jgi:hypothetical protein
VIPDGPLDSVSARQLPVATESTSGFAVKLSTNDSAIISLRRAISSHPVGLGAIRRDNGGFSAMHCTFSLSSRKLFLATVLVRIQGAVTNR